MHFCERFLDFGIDFFFCKTVTNILILMYLFQIFFFQVCLLFFFQENMIALPTAQALSMQFLSISFSGSHCSFLLHDYDPTIPLTQKNNA